MDKRMLRKVERPLAEPEYFTQALLNASIRYVVKVKKINDILQLAFFKRTQLIKEKPEAEYRIFVADNDYITQDLKSTGTKWLTGKFTSVFSIDWWTYRSAYQKDGIERFSDFAFADVESKELLIGRYGEPEPTESVWDRFTDWQEKVCAARLKARHEKELQHTNEMMELVPELPGDFEQWCQDYALYNYRYLIYDAASSKRMKMAYCSHCGEYMSIDSKTFRLRNNETTICPKCESRVRMKTFKRWHDCEWCYQYACILQKAGDYLIARYFDVKFVFSKGSLDLGIGFEKKFYISEKCRAFFCIKNEKVTKESFEFTNYKQTTGLRWCPDQNDIPCKMAVVYTHNLPGELKETAFQYSGIEAYQNNEGCFPINIWNYMQAYPENKWMEGVVKFGLTHLMHDILADPWKWRDSNKGASEKIAKRAIDLPKSYSQILRKINGGIAELETLEHLTSWKHKFTIEDVTRWMSMFGAKSDIIRFLGLNEITIRKFMNYIEKQRILSKKVTVKREKVCTPAYLVNVHQTSAERLRTECCNLMQDWRDYLGWSEKLGYNMEDEYVLFPPDLSKAHDRLFKEYKELQNKQEQERLRKESEKIQKILQEVGSAEPLAMKSKKFMIVVPKTASDIKLEGQTLHHCVGTYVERVAKGQTMILFVRKVTEPDVPYFTMEWREHRVIQCRGRNNCSMPSDVNSFVKAFEKKMAEYELKNERKAG